MIRKLLKIDSYLQKKFLHLFGLRINYLLIGRRFIFKNRIIAYPLEYAEKLKDNCNYLTVFKEEQRCSDFSSISSLFKPFEEIIPELNAYRLDHVRFNVSTKVFIKDKTAYVPRVQELKNSDFSGGTNSVIYNNGKHLLWNVSKSIKIEKGIILGGHYFSNWGHWKVEFLSALFVLIKSKWEFSDYTLIIPKKLENSRNHVDLLLSFNLPNPILFVEEKTDIICEKSIVVDSVFNSVPLSKVHQSLTKTNVHYDALRGYARFLRKAHPQELKQSDTENFFLARKQGGKLINRKYNQDEVFEYFKSFGFKAIYAEDLSLKQQVELFANANFIVGEAGSSFFNILYANPQKAKVFCWAAYFEEVAPLYARLALPLGIDIKYYYFKTEHQTWVDFRSKGSYNLDIKALDMIFKPYYNDPRNKTL